MTISAGSRYANNVTQAVTGSDGVTRLTIMPRSAVARTMAVVDYLWGPADRVDLVAGRVFGDETMWWAIANANPQILDWTAVAPGTVVRIPNGIN